MCSYFENIHATIQCQKPPVTLSNLGRFGGANGKFVKSSVSTQLQFCFLIARHHARMGTFLPCSSKGKSMVHLVAYDLRKKGIHDYTALFAALKSFGAYFHAQESVWLVVSTSSPAAVAEYLRQHIHADDRLLVVGSDGYGGWMPKAAWEWLRNHQTVKA